MRAETAETLNPAEALDPADPDLGHRFRVALMLTGALRCRVCKTYGSGKAACRYRVENTQNPTH